MVSPGERLRMVDTPEGSISYCLTRKRVKNLNLRVDARGRVCLSVPLGCSDARADRMVREHSGWITRVLFRQAGQRRELPPAPTRFQCQALLEEALDRVWPLVVPLGVARPVLKLRKMRSLWGNCHWDQGYITLNTALGRCPEHLRDYVALHELVHFLHHDHGPGFRGQMDALMPDWRGRREELKGYAAALTEET